jgi:hypothetical protein
MKPESSDSVHTSQTHSFINLRPALVIPHRQQGKIKLEEITNKKDKIMVG